MENVSRTDVAQAATPTLGGPEAVRALVLNTLGFALCFWAWALMSPLGPYYKDVYGLSAFAQAFLVAIPVVVGALGRIPVGALTDKLGSRVMMPLISAITIVPVLFLGLVAHSYLWLAIGGFVLGIAGTSFAVGVPAVNAWFPPAKRGLAVGIFGAGMGGTAIAAFTTVKLKNAIGEPAPFILVAVLLAIYAVVAAMLLRDAPNRKPATGNWLARAWTTFKQPVTLQMSWLYAIAFGGFVAFSVYLPTYLKAYYNLTPEDASLRTAGFVVLAVIMRPVGGYLSDRFHPVPVLAGVFATSTIFATASALGMHIAPGATIAFLGLALALGTGTGAVFALVGKLVEPAKVGAVTGIVGAAGGLGGFIPPLIMGAVAPNYHLGLGLLAIVSLLTLAFTVAVFWKRYRQYVASVPPR